MSSFEKHIDNIKGVIIEKLLLAPVTNSLAYSLYSFSFIKCFQFHDVGLYTFEGLPNLNPGEHCSKISIQIWHILQY